MRRASLITPTFGSALRLTREQAGPAPSQDTTANDATAAAPCHQGRAVVSYGWFTCRGPTPDGSQRTVSSMTREHASQIVLPWAGHWFRIRLAAGSDATT